MTNLDEIYNMYFGDDDYEDVRRRRDPQRYVKEQRYIQSYIGRGFLIVKVDGQTKDDVETLLENSWQAKDLKTYQKYAHPIDQELLVRREYNHSCNNCLYRIFIGKFLENLSPAPMRATYVDKRGNRRGQGLFYQLATSGWYCRLRLENIMRQFGLDPELISPDEVYKYLDEEDIEPAMIARRAVQRLNDRYVRHRRDLVYFTELGPRTWHYTDKFRPWARSKSRVIQEAMEEEVCKNYVPRGVR